MLAEKGNCNVVFQNMNNNPPIVVGLELFIALGGEIIFHLLVTYMFVKKLFLV